MTAVEGQLLISIATILCSGVVSTVITHRLSTGRAEREFRRKKLEELFVAIHRYCTKLTTWNLVSLRVMRGELDYSQAQQIRTESHTAEDNSHETIIMLINIYFPELLPAFDAVLKRRDQINRIQHEFRDAYRRGESGEPFAHPLAQELTAIDVDEKRITEELFQLSKAVQ